MALIGHALLLGYPADADQLAGKDQLLIDVPGDGRGFVRKASVPLLAAPGLMPGTDYAQTLTLRNDSDYDGRLALRLLALKDLENGCVSPERSSGDETCQRHHGELSHWLHIDVGRKTDSSLVPLWTGKLDELRNGVVLPEEFASKTDLPIQLTLSVPAEAGNELQTDGITGRLRWTIRTDKPGGSTPAGGTSGTDEERGRRAGASTTGPDAWTPTASPAYEPWTAAVGSGMVFAGLALILRLRRNPFDPTQLRRHGRRSRR